MDVSEKIIDEYREKRARYERLGEIVEKLLGEVAKNTGVRVMAIEGRIKSEESLKGKLTRKGEKYRSLTDITDIYGARVICFFSDDVDKFAAEASKLFVVDEENSVDKRAVLSPDAFGYLSLHFVFSLPKNAGYENELCEIRFELQIRSLLQHAWAEMQHDMGYKSAFGTPKNVVREFSRVAGLLEIADKMFCEIRDGVKRYGEEIEEKIGNGTAGDMEADLTTLAIYMKQNAAMRAFTEKLAAACGLAGVTESPSDPYLAQLKYLGINTLGGIDELIEKDGEEAIRLAKSELKKELAAGGDDSVRTVQGGTESCLRNGSERSAQDGGERNAQSGAERKLPSSASLKYLLNAELLRRNCTEKEMASFFKAAMKDFSRAERLAKRLYETGLTENDENKENNE